MKLCPLKPSHDSHLPRPFVRGTFGFLLLRQLYQDVLEDPIRINHHLFHFIHLCRKDPGESWLGGAQPLLLDQWDDKVTS